MHEPGLKPGFDEEIDVRGLNCPLPLLRTKKMLSRISRKALSMCKRSPKFRTIPTTSKRDSPRNSCRTTTWRSRRKSKSGTTTRCQIPLKKGLAAVGAGDGMFTVGSPNS